MSVRKASARGPSEQGEGMPKKAGLDERIKRQPARDGAFERSLAIVNEQHRAPFDACMCTSGTLQLLEHKI